MDTGFAPRRFRLTQAVVNGDRKPRVGWFKSNPVSFLAALPLAAPCYAVRLGFMNGFNLTQSISKATVYPSDTYSGALAALTSVKERVVPTDGGKIAVGSPIFFDGLGDAALNVAGRNRGLTLPTTVANPENAFNGGPITWSDWSPCFSRPRADGGAWPLLFVAITVTSRDFVSTASSSVALNQALHRGKQMAVGLRAVTEDVDFADDPGGTAWGFFGTPPLGPWFVLQYLTTVPSVQVVLTGDSLTASPLSDGVSNAVWRAVADLSLGGVPVELLNLGIGGATWQAYQPMFGLNADAVQPSVLIPQVISRNGMGGAADMGRLLAMALLEAQTCSVRYGSKLIWNIPGCEPSWDDVPAFSDGFVDMRNRLLGGSIPVIDAPSVIGDVAGGKPWNHIGSPVISDDNTHLNAAGQELVVPLATAALKTVIGLS